MLKKFMVIMRALVCAVAIVNSNAHGIFDMFKYVVLEKDLYMGDGDDSPSWGMAGVNNVYGPFETKPLADAFAHRANASDMYAVEFEVRELRMDLPNYIEQSVPKKYKAPKRFS